MKRQGYWGVIVASLGTLAAIAGCASPPGSQRIVGPDGSAMAHVHCGDDQGSCFRLAGELCPSGYDIQPVLSGVDGNFLVRCHAAPVIAAAVPAPAPRLPATAPTPPPPAQRAASEAWPPAHEPWPATYPWPPPETSVVVQKPRAPAAKPTGPDGEVVDLGY